MIVVVEGLDATGKSTLCKTLASLFNGVVYSTPPAKIRDRRNKIDSMASPEKSFHFYREGIKIANEEIREISRQSHVFIDRHWVSTAVTHLAMGVSVNIDAMASYHVADFTILLTVDRATQASRFKERGMTQGDHNLLDLYDLVDRNFRVLVTSRCHPYAVVDTSLLSLCQVVNQVVLKLGVFV